MRFYVAPLEGITGYIYRNAFHEYFDSIYRDFALKRTVDKYFAPFISPGNHKKLTSKENCDVDPANNRDICLIPQILTNDAGCFCRTAQHLYELGYTEVNLNLGCPSGTVVAKHKGAGMLEDWHQLDSFLHDIYCDRNMEISIKTRIGMEEVDEWPEILKIFNQYPIHELIVHPRLCRDLYKGSVHMEMFAYTMEHADMPVCYNGDIFTVQDFEHIQAEYPDLKSVMLGRGLLTNPALIRQILTGQSISKTEFVSFHNMIFEAYEREMSGDRNLLFKMKELWNYWAYLFENPDVHLKRIRKVQSKQEYAMLVSNIIKYNEISEQGYQPIG